jgi:hypothetical protein
MRRPSSHRTFSSNYKPFSVQKAKRMENAGFAQYIDVNAPEVAIMENLRGFGRARAG